LVRNMFFWGRRVLSYFRGQCPNFRGQCPNLQNAGNEIANRKAYYRFDVFDYYIFGFVHAGVASIPPHTHVMEVNTKPLLSIPLSARLLGAGNSGSLKEAKSECPNLPGRVS